MGKTAMQSVRDLLEQNEYEFISKDATLNLLRVYIQFEKQQIINAYFGGLDGWMTSTKEGYQSGAEQYYNETYTND